MVKSHHQGSDHYSEAIPELGLAYLSEVEWTVPKPGRMHSHAEHQLLYVLKGEMIVEVSGRRYEERGGALFVLPAGLPHAVYNLEAQPRLHFIDVRFQADPPVTMGQYVLSLGETRLYLSEKAALQMAANLRSALAGTGNARVSRLHAALWESLSSVKPEQDPGVPEGGRYQLRAAEETMRVMLKEPLDVGILAETVGLSRSQLTRLFLKQSGVGPAERLRQIRVEYACELLRTGRDSIKEIAHECGFVCPNHFCRVFGNMMRTTPSEYRAGFEGG